MSGPTSSGVTAGRWTAGAVCCGLMVLGCATLYLSQWLNMPLYQDEVALRVLRARFLTDGVMDYGLFAQCASNTRTIASVFWPAAWLYATYDGVFGWTGIRALPLAVVLISLGVVLVQVLKTDGRTTALVLLAGLVGVAGSGLVLSRMETPTLAFGALCLVGYMLIQRPTTSRLPLALYFVFATFTALFALFIHPQAMVFVPIILLLGLAVAVGPATSSRWMKGVAGLSIACVVIGAVAAWDNTALRCPEMPALESQFDQMGLPGLVQEQGFTGMQTNLRGKLGRYVGSFRLRKDYDIGYLPGITPASRTAATLIALLNGAIGAIVLLNLFLAGAVAIVAAFTSIRMAWRTVRDRRSHWMPVVLAPSTFLFLATSSHLALFVYDTPTNFYRAFYIHFVLVAVNAMAVAQLSARHGRIAAMAGAFSLMVCLSSAVVIHRNIRPKFLAGWEGPSISLKTDWGAVDAEVQKAAARCGIGADWQRVVVDDMTYDAMKHHRHLLPLRWITMGRDFRTMKAGDAMQFFRKLPATGLVTQCKSLDAINLPGSTRINGFCCLRFSPSH